MLITQITQWALTVNDKELSVARILEWPIWQSGNCAIKVVCSFEKNKYTN